MVSDTPSQFKHISLKASQLLIQTTFYLHMTHGLEAICWVPMQPDFAPSFTFCHTALTSLCLLKGTKHKQGEVTDVHMGTFYLRWKGMFKFKSLKHFSNYKAQWLSILKLKIVTSDYFFIWSKSSIHIFLKDGFFLYGKIIQMEADKVFLLNQILIHITFMQ